MRKGRQTNVRLESDTLEKIAKIKHAHGGMPTLAAVIRRAVDVLYEIDCGDQRSAKKAKPA